MAFYDLSKKQRAELSSSIKINILDLLKAGKYFNILVYFKDEDTYIRKTAYLAIGRIFLENNNLQDSVIDALKAFWQEDDYRIRQTVINAAGEIGKHNFEIVTYFFENGLFDPHHAPRNAVIGSLKKMGDVNPQPILRWTKKYLYHENPEIRRQICHGLELRGRKYPQDILPLLKELQFDQTARVRNTLIHVLGQIAYKKGCLKTVIAHLKGWENTKLVDEALSEIIDVHHRYQNFAAMTAEEAERCIFQYFEK